MAVENSLYDKKSLRTVVGKTADFSELAKDCVAFANSRGGTIDIGIEDADTLPPEGQKIPDSLIPKIEKRIAETTINVNCSAEKIVAENGGEHIKLHVFYNKSTIAGTTDGKYYMRVGDSSKPVKADEFSFILTDRTSYVWESQKGHEKFSECDKEKTKLFINDIKSSSRVSDFIKSKSDNELLEHYCLATEDGFLTNLGCLWESLRKTSLIQAFRETRNSARFSLTSTTWKRKAAAIICFISFCFFMESRFQK